MLTVELTVLGIACLGLNAGRRAKCAFDAMMAMKKIEIVAIEAARLGASRTLPHTLPLEVTLVSLAAVSAQPFQWLSAK
jgi:hypothetical protein